MNKAFSNKGFTLIEILIVVAIIAILASSVLVGFGPAQKQGRDARRISDLRQTQNALELYYAKCGHYPGDRSCTNTDPTSWSTLSDEIVNSGIGINQKLPNDPTGGQTYTYKTDAAHNTYVIMAVLESPSKTAMDSSAQGTILGITCGGASNNYCIQF